MITTRLARLAALPVLVLFTWFAVGCESSAVDASSADADKSLTVQAREATSVLPPGARFVAMTDVQQIQANSPFSPFSGEASMFDGSSSEGAARARDFFEAIDFNPEEDLKQVYVAAEGDQPSAASLVIYADLQADRIDNYLNERYGDDLSTTTYNGTTLYEIEHDGHGDKTMAFTVANDQMALVASSLDRLQAMIDRLQGEGRSLSDDTDLLEKVQRAAQGQSAWFVVQNISDLPFGDPEGDAPGNLERLDSKLEDGIGAFTFTDSGEMQGTVFFSVTDGASASDVADVVRGALSAARSSDDLSDAERSALDDIRVTAQDNEVQIRFTLNPEALSRFERS